MPQLIQGLHVNIFCDICPKLLMEFVFNPASFLYVNDFYTNYFKF